VVGKSHSEALAIAQAKVRAEGDGRFEVEGWDAESRLIILAPSAARQAAILVDVEGEGITGVSPWGAETSQSPAQGDQVERQGVEWGRPLSPQRAADRTRSLSSHGRSARSHHHLLESEMDIAKTGDLDAE